MNPLRLLALALAAVAAGPAPAVAAATPELTGEPKLEPARRAAGITGEVAAVGDRLRVACYNIEEFTDGRGDAPMRNTAIAARHARMAAAILDRLDADIVLLQEIENEAILAQLNRELKRPFAAGYITAYGDGAGVEEKMNEAVLARVPLERVTELDFGPLKGEWRPPRGLLRAEASLGGNRRLLLYTGHLKSNYGLREKAIAQRRAAVARLRADADRVTADTNAAWEVLFAGDMNVDPQQPQFAADPSFEALRGWTDLSADVRGPGRTTCPTRYGDPAEEFPPACFDRVFVSPSLREPPWTAGRPRALAAGCETRDVAVPPGFGDHVSDHYPVTLDLSAAYPPPPTAADK